MKPRCLELWVASRDKSECINYCKKHKVTQTKKTSIRAFGFFLENEHSSKSVLLLRAPRKFVREHLSNGLTLRAFRKLEVPFATPRQTERETNRQTDRGGTKTDRQIDRHIDRKDRQTDK